MDTRYAERLGAISDHVTITTEKTHENTVLEEIRDTMKRHLQNAGRTFAELHDLHARIAGSGPATPATPEKGEIKAVPGGMLDEITGDQCDLTNLLNDISRRVADLRGKL
jgi:hypothetical protein